MKVCATTIVSANYLAYAKVLAASICEHFSEAAFYVLLVERKTPAMLALTEALPFELVWPEDLGLPDLDRIAYQYDILELNTCLKPTYLKRMLSQGYDAVVYWDPDIRLFAAPEPVLAGLARASVVLTPHIMSPLLDGRRPSEIDIMRHGLYNLGFIALRGDLEGLALLDWWEDRCLSYGFSDHALGTFVDQKWLDLAPCYFQSVHVLRHRGCNVAYWNLQERVIAEAPEGLRAGPDELIFFHFSGVDWKLPNRLSKYQDRHELIAGTPLQRLVADYCNDLRLQGHDTFVNTPYSFGVLSNGSPIGASMRRALGSFGKDETRPFDSSSRFQQRLARIGLGGENSPAERASAEPKITSFNFDPADYRVVLVNRLLRLTRRLIGLKRLELLLRYCVFLARGSNFASVLACEPFTLDHRPREVLQNNCSDEINGPAANASAGS
jgi:hypothetical protein